MKTVLILLSAVISFLMNIPAQNHSGRMKTPPPVYHSAPSYTHDTGKTSVKTDHTDVIKDPHITPEPENKAPDKPVVSQNTSPSESGTATNNTTVPENKADNDTSSDTPASDNNTSDKEIIPEKTTTDENDITPDIPEADDTAENDPQEDITPVSSEENMNDDSTIHLPRINI